MDAGIRRLSCWATAQVMVLSGAIVWLIIHNQNLDWHHRQHGRYIYTVGSGWSQEYEVLRLDSASLPRLHLFTNGNVFYSAPTTSALFDPPIRPGRSTWPRLSMMLAAAMARPCSCR